MAPLDREIRVVGVDISFKAFIRRIFPGALGRGPIPKHVIDWANVASLAHGTGVVKSTESRAALGQLRPADLADLIEDLAGRERNALIEMLDPDLAADALEEMEDEELQGLLRGLSAQRSAELVSRMEPDEGAEVLRDLDDNHRESILLEMDVSVAKQLRKLVEFDETLAGGTYFINYVMTDYFDVENLQIGGYNIKYEYTDPVTSCYNEITEIITISDSPEAGMLFSPQPTDIDEPNILFRDNSNEEVLISEWHLGDGTIIYDSLSFWHTYADTGTYTIKYYITNYTCYRLF